MLAVTGRDKPWLFFHFWRHHFQPNLASSMLNFLKRRRSFQWCPDQSDEPNGAWDMHKNAQNVEQKTQTEICCHHTWLLHGKSCPSRWRFPRSFLTASKPARRSITAAKRKEKEKKERPKKNSKHRKAERHRSLSRPCSSMLNFCKRRRSFQWCPDQSDGPNFDFCACPSQNVAKRDASGKKAKLSWCKCIFDQIKADLAEIQPKSHQNVQEMPFSQKARGVNELISSY